MRRTLVLAAFLCGFLLAAALLASTARASTSPAGAVGDLVAAVAGKDKGSSDGGGADKSSGEKCGGSDGEKCGGLGGEKSGGSDGKTKSDKAVDTPKEHKATNAGKRGQAESGKGSGDEA